VARTLSSQWTFTYKYIFPIFYVWLAVKLVGLWRHTSTTVANAATHHASPNPIWLLFPLMLIVMLAAAWHTMRYVMVRLDDDGVLVVSGYFGREWRVPGNLITDVRQNRWLKLRPITVRLRSDVGCGTRFTFTPPYRMFRQWTFWKEDPEVAELRDMMEGSSAGWRSRLVPGGAVEDAT